MTTVPFVDLKMQYRSIKAEVDPAIQNVLDNTAFVLGKSVENFETAFKQMHNVKHCICVSSGTDGNHLAILALGIGPGDEVIVPANTFIASAWGVTLCGATPVFVDCEPDSYNLDPAKLEAAITPRTKAVVVVHLYGQAANIDAIKAVTDKHGIALVEDAAQAHLSEFKGRKVGGLGRIASWSFYPGKNLGAYGEGGAVTTNDDALARTVTLFRQHGAEEKYIHETLGHNYRMEGIQGAVLGVKMKYIQDWTEKRRAVAKKYGEQLGMLEQIQLPTEMPYAKHVYHLYVIQIGRPRPGDLTKGVHDWSKEEDIRNRLAAFLKDNGVATGLHYPVPLHLQPCFKHLPHRFGNFPVSERLAKCGLSLPMFPELTDEQIVHVTSKVREFFAKR
jgi:dTDP-4-amino-4,6-dideoxygalactose transaminase